tara:strand:- start:5827 stop:6588 length:762 start_codon:yes stop_codon:yes gene_type:complete
MTECGSRTYVLNTRPEADASELTVFFEDANIPVINDPLIQIAFLDGPVPDTANVSGLIFTSRNGVRAYVQRSEFRGLHVYAVGDATARFAAEQGFAFVQSAGGGVNSLISLIVNEVDVKSGELLHVAGTAVAGDLLNSLLMRGYNVRREVMYEAKPAKRFSTRTIEAVNNDELRSVVFFSPRTARTFARLIEGKLERSQFKFVSAYCLSRAVASEIATVPWRQVHVAQSPTLPAFLELFAQSGEFEDGDGKRS